VSVHSEVIKVEAADEGSFACYVAHPVRPNGAVLVVLQEIFGVNADIRAIVDGFATQGFLAFAPDLFWRQEPAVELDPSSATARERATTLMKGLSPPQAVEDAATAIQSISSLFAPQARAFAVGYCLGGKLAYLLAARGAVEGAVSYYGVGIQGVLEEATHLKGLLLLHVAADDHLCPPEAQRKITEALAPLGDRASVLTYPGVGHAFARRGGTAFNEQAAHRANQATTEFLQAALASE
jgi:carboxymethylenebutenolidase